MHFLHLIRYPNLLITLGVQWLCFQYLLVPLLPYPVPFPFDLATSLLLMGATMAALAGGNVINDLHDIEADRINKPERQLIGRHISVRTGWIIYGAMLIVSGLLTIAYWWLNPGLTVPLVVCGASVLLWIYARWLKQRPVVGNLTVALLCGLAIWMFLLAFRPALEDATTYPAAHTYFVLFASFGVLATWYREMVKDWQDRRGDAQAGLRTLAVILPQSVNRRLLLLVLALLMLLLLGSGVVLAHQLGFQGFLYLGGLVLTTALLAVSTSRAETKHDFARLSFWTKLYFVQGMLYVIFWHV